MAGSTTVKTKISDKAIDSTYEKSEDGYYKIRLGKLNAFNRHGVYYRVSNLDKLIGQGSVFYNRITEGFLRSEVGHPEAIREAGKITNPSERAKALTRAIMFINLENVCAHIKEVTFVKTGKREKGFTNEIIEVYGWVKPSGVKKDLLESVFENPGENAAFSIRSLVINKIENGLLVKEVLEISTWDYVYEPGVAGSSKWGGAGIEDMEYSFPELSSSELDGLLDTGLDSQCVDGQCLIKKLKSTANKNLSKKWMLG